VSGKSAALAPLTCSGDNRIYNERNSGRISLFKCLNVILIQSLQIHMVELICNVGIGKQLDNVPPFHVDDNRNHHG